MMVMKMMTKMVVLKLRIEWECIVPRQRRVNVTMRRVVSVPMTVLYRFSVSKLLM